MCVTATEKTSEVPDVQQSMELEGEESRRKYFSPLNRTLPQDKADDASSTDAAMTVAANPEDARISSLSHCCKLMRKGP